MNDCCDAEDVSERAECQSLLHKRLTLIAFLSVVLIQSTIEFVRFGLTVDLA
jgi:hypothetical protein